MKAYGKSLTSEAILVQLYDYLDDNELLLNAPYLFDRDFTKSLENYYFYAWSGDKLVSPVVRKNWDCDDEELDNQEDLMLMFWHVHSKQLLRLWADAVAEYEPDKPYHVIETTEYEHEGTSGYEDSGADTFEKDGTITESGTVVSGSQIYGFNSNTAADDSKTTVTKGLNGNDLPQTEYDTVDTKRYGKKRDAGETASDDLTVEKQGNLGVQSIGQMLGEDIELWKWNFYKNGLFKLLDSFLTIPIY